MEKSHSTHLLWWLQLLLLPLEHPTWSSPIPACWTRIHHSLHQNPVPKLTGGAAAVGISHLIPWTLLLYWRCNPLATTPPSYCWGGGESPTSRSETAQWHLSTRPTRARKGNDVAPDISLDRKTRTNESYISLELVSSSHNPRTQWWGVFPPSPVTAVDVTIHKLLAVFLLGWWMDCLTWLLLLR